MSQEDQVIGKAYIQVKEIVKKYAKNDENILFVGERGTGKEEFAKLYKKCAYSGDVGHPFRMKSATCSV